MLAEQIAAECLVLRARLLARRLTRLYDQALRSHGVSSARLNLLAAICYSPGLRAADLVTALDLEKSTVSRDIARLVADQLVAQRPGRGRTLHLFPTKKGAARLEALFADWSRAQAEAARLIGDNVAWLRAIEIPGVASQTDAGPLSR